MRRPLALSYQYISSEGLQLNLEFLDHATKLLFIKLSYILAG
jgi:hypothetical protein